jgi:hypothetical protein
MNPQKKQKLKWMALGALVSLVVALVAACCCWPSAPAAEPPRLCADAGSPVVVATPDAGAACDAAPPTVDVDALPAFDAGPSCGSNPWCPHPKECCSKASDCCA